MSCCFPNYFVYLSRSNKSVLPLYLFYLSYLFYSLTLAATLCGSSERSNKFGKANCAKATFAEAELAENKSGKARLLKANWCKAKLIKSNHAHFRLGSCWDKLYIYIYISRNIGGQRLRAPTVDIPGRGGTFFDFGGLFIKKTAWSSAACNGP